MTTEASAGGDDLRDSNTVRNRWYQISMTFTRYHWRCNEFSGTFEADTIEPSAAWGGTNKYYDDNRVPVATSNTVQQVWFNKASRLRRLCGETHAPTGFTRVQTGARSTGSWLSLSPLPSSSASQPDGLSSNRARLRVTVP